MSVVNLGPHLIERLRPIKLAAFDIDGTLTDGTILMGEGGPFKSIHAHDGQGLRLLLEAHIAVAFITALQSDVIAKLGVELGLEFVFQGVRDKGKALLDLQSQLGLSPLETLAMGDDLPDLAMFHKAGVRVAVPGSALEVQKAADWVTSRPPGRGAVRELCEQLLKAQGVWEQTVERFDR
jgi:3-deoxy-D-manno-octulosonate 8-phosphate phosphatase (KDO 8-P phosphatase)